MIVIGIVGSPAGGKSAVASMLEERGATWVNADLVARDVLQRPEVQAKLIAHFGLEITDSDGRIDRRKLANKVFGADDVSRAALNYLEGLIHPRTRRLIRETLHQLALNKSPVAILDVPLLFESGWDRACDQVWCVDARFETRLARASKRGWDADELKRREANQLSIDEKKRLSTLVIENNDSLADLARRVELAYQQLITQPTASDEHCL